MYLKKVNLAISEMIKESKLKVEATERNIAIQKGDLENTKKNLSEDTNSWLMQHEKLQVSYQIVDKNLLTFNILPCFLFCRIKWEFR